jgi:hypothetical protein
MRLNQIRVGCCFLACWAAMPHQLEALDKAPKQRCTAKTPAELNEWQTSTRQLLFQLLKLSDLSKQREESPSKIPFNERILASEDKGKYILREIEFDSTPTRRIKAIVTIPAALRAVSPAVVCIPGHNSNRRVVYDRSTPYRGFADELASRDYVTISTDVGQHEVYEKGRTLMGERLWDVLRCADYVSTLKEVEAERMGCAGLSLGGEMAMWLGAMDARMKVTVTAGKALQPPPIPLIGTGRTMSFDPVQEFVAQHHDELARGSGCYRRGGRLGRGHEIAVLRERGFAVWSEINLTPSQLDVPELAGLTEKRFWIMRHGEPSGLRNETHRSGPKGSRPPAGRRGAFSDKVL